MKLTAMSVLADERDFTIVNQTGHALEFLAVKPLGDAEWTENRLSRPLPDGASLDIHFTPRDPGGALYHIKATCGAWTLARTIDVVSVRTVILTR